MNVETSKPHIVIIAGEESGDVLGASLMERLIRIYPNAQFTGVGGNEMKKTVPEFQSIFEMSDLSIMGIMEVIPSLPRILKRLKQAKTYIIDKQPNIVITIDAPDFNNRVVKAVRDQCLNTQFVHYVAPSVWAWRPKRAKKISRIYDRLLCLLPFEPPFFEEEGLKSLFVGHPVIKIIGDGFSEEERKNIRGNYSDHEQKTYFVSILFGSRNGEIKRHSKMIIKAMKLIKDQYPDTTFFIPAFDKYKTTIAEELFKLGFDKSDFYFVMTDQRYNLFKISDYAIAVSGTVGLELAVAGTPHSICYRFGAMTGFLAKRILKTPYVHIANIVLNKAFIPEFLQGQCRADLIAEDACKALEQNRRTDETFKKDINDVAKKLSVTDLDHKFTNFLS